MSIGRVIALQMLAGAIVGVLWGLLSVALDLSDVVTFLIGVVLGATTALIVGEAARS